jgi:hypothetical protein
MNRSSSSPRLRDVRLWCIALALCASGACAGDEGGADTDDEKGAAEQQEESPLAKRFPPIAAVGEPLAAADNVWTYVEFPETKCRDGSAAGIGLSLNSASKSLMIYLEGGGACFDAITCLTNPTNNSAGKSERTQGLFDRTRAENPVRDWNFVYVPYCTGDTHGGTRENGTVVGVSGPQQFVGRLNLEKFLHRIARTLPEPTDLLLTGISAGGFGAAQNGVLVQRFFPKVKVRVIDDSGPPLSTAVVPECLQQKWRETWGLENSVLADCGADCPNPNDFSQPYGLAMARLFDDRPSGLIESARDSVIAAFYGAGLNNCTGTALLNQVPAMTFQDDLLAYREKVRPFANFSTYIPDSTQHTWLGGASLFTASAGGVRLVDWVATIIRGESPGHAGP